MLEGVDVHQTMLGLELMLTKKLRSGSLQSTTVVDGMDPNIFGAGNLRRAATIVTEFHSGSDRPVVGPAIRQAKRAVRRGLRWYVGALFEQQSRFNHRLVDVIEKVTVRNERLMVDMASLEGTLQDQAAEIERLRHALDAPEPGDRRDPGPS